MTARLKIARCHTDRPNYYGGKCKECYDWIRDQSAPCPHNDRKKDYHGRCSSCMSRYYYLRRLAGLSRTHGTPRAREITQRERGPDYEPMRWKQRKLKELSEKQNGLCAICGLNDPKGLCLDHDHSCCPKCKACSKCIRQALCHGCNMRLGQLESDLLKRSIEYLVKHNSKSIQVFKECLKNEQ